MTSALKRAFRPLTAVLLGLQMLLISGLTFAQSQGGGGGGLDVNVNTGPSAVWYGQWWVWAIGIAVFLVVIVALTNRGSRA